MHTHRQQLAAARRAHIVHALLQPGEAVAHIAVEPLPLRGEHHAPPRALEEIDAELFFEHPHLEADRAMGEAELVGRARIADMARRRLEGAQGGKGQGPDRHPDMLVQLTDQVKISRSYQRKSAAICRR
jgi:hypothetical protein